MAAAFTHLVPFSELKEGQAAAIRNATIEKLCQDACKLMNLNMDKLVVRDIDPNGDLDYTYEDWQETTGTTGDTYETMTTGTMGDQTFVGIYGVMVSNNACTSLRFDIGGGYRAIWQLQNLKDNDNGVGFCPSAITIPQNTVYTISRYVRAVSTPTTIVLRGVLVEPRGLTISP
jgi:hypothetical protein